MAATSSFDDTIRLWDITDPARPGCWTLTGHEGNVKPVAFSPDGRALAPGSDDRDVRIRDLTDPHHAVPVAVLEGHRHFVDASPTAGTAVRCRAGATTVRRDCGTSATFPGTAHWVSRGDTPISSPAWPSPRTAARR
ncbi:WD40 repeat domain-containing protein [Streptomyces luteogriseus]|uniref:WD40 repeat domain-containing protein n=1 Tax=Streptomyces luteogriseus TaxID=68233 RepID=UPI0037F6D223